MTGPSGRRPPDDDADSAPGAESSASSREARLTAAFVAFASTIVSEFDLTVFLQNVVHTCVDLFALDSAGLMLADQEGRLRVVASSSESARVVELAQLASDAGPCLESFTTRATVVVPDIAARRSDWPEFADVAIANGLRSSYATPMRLQEQTLGTINLFSGRLNALDETDLSVAKALTEVATIGIVQERLLREARTSAEQLQTALTSRILVEQAKGVLATRTGSSMDDAFRAMRQHSRSTNTPIREVARGIVEGSVTPAHLDA